MGQIGRFICPQCNTVNVQDGNCYKCGADLQARGGEGHDEDDSPGPAQGRTQWQHGGDEGRSLREMQSGFQLSKRQVVIIGALALLGLSLVLMMGGGGGGGGGGGSGPTNTTSNPNPPEKIAEVAAAVALAEKFAAFQDKAPEGWVFEDTSKDTPGMPSFGMRGEKPGIQMKFIVWDNPSITENLNLVVEKVPFTDLVPAGNLREATTAKGDGFVGEQPFPWMAVRCHHGDDAKTVLTLVGAYKSPVEGKAIVFVAHPVESKDEAGNRQQAEIFDYKTALWLLDTMTANYTRKVRGETAEEPKPEAPAEPETPVATAEELANYCTKVGELVKASFKPVKDDAVEEPKTVVLIAVSEDGKVSKLEIAEASGSERVDQSLVKAVTAAQPFPKAPHTKAGSVLMHITADGDKLQCELQ